MLSIIEGRVLGCLLEKERTTPDQYPLTLNALVLGCNQSTSRDPVMHIADYEIESTLTSLKSAGLLRFVHPTHGRSVTRYRQVADESWGIGPEAAALLAVLLLRGPQTVAELRTRAERQHHFATPEAVEEALSELSAARHVQLLERQTGQKEVRWQQLLAEEAQPAESLAASPTAGSMAERVELLEARVARLEAALDDLLPPIPPELAVESFEPTISEP